MAIENSDAVVVSTDDLTAVGDAIRDKTGTTDTYTISEMANAIENIQTGANVTMEDNTEGGVDLTVDDITRTLSKQSDLITKQDKLTAGTHIAISDDNVISVTGGGEGGSVVTMTDNESGGIDLTVDDTTRTLAKESELPTITYVADTDNNGMVLTINGTGEDLAKISIAMTAKGQAEAALSAASAAVTTAQGKQDKLTAGTNITISDDNVISATGGGSSTVTLIDDESGGVDLTVEDTTRNLALQSDLNKTWTGYQTTSNILVGYRRSYTDGTVETYNGCYCSKDIIEIPEGAVTITWNPNTGVSSYSNDLILYDSTGEYVGKIYGKTTQTATLSNFTTAKYVGFSASDSTLFAGVATYSTSTTSDIELWSADAGSFKTGINGKQDKITMSENTEGGVDLTVNGATQTLAKQSDITEKEWVLVGTISATEDDRGNLDTGLTVDLTGKTELYIFAKVTGNSGDGNFVGVTPNGTFALTSAINKTGSRSFVGTWESDPLGLHPTSGRTQDTLTADNLKATANMNAWVNGSHIADITQLTYDNPTTTVSCDIRVYAR